MKPLPIIVLGALVGVAIGLGLYKQDLAHPRCQSCRSSQELSLTARRSVREQPGPVFHIHFGNRHLCVSTHHIACKYRVPTIGHLITGPELPGFRLGGVWRQRDVLMWKVFAAIIFLGSAAFAQTSVEGFFTVHHAKKVSFVLPAAQMHEAEKLYLTTCATVQREFQAREELRPHFVMVLGAASNQLSRDNELWLKEWNPSTFTQAVVIMAFEEMLTRDRRIQLTLRALQQYNASVDVADLNPHR